MANNYHLACSKCQHQLVVEKRHAGQIVECEKCQHSQEIPKLRDFNRLTPVSGTTELAGVQSIPNPLRPWFFVIGLGSLVLFGFGGWAIKYFADQTLAMSQKIDQIDPEIFDKLDPADLYRGWHDGFSENRELPPWRSSEAGEARYQALILRNVAYTLLGVAALGALLIATSFLLPNRKLRPRTVPTKK